MNSPSNPIKAYFTSSGNYRQQHYRGSFNNSRISFPSIEAIEGGGFTGTLGLQPLALGFSVPPFSGEFFEFTFSGGEPAGLYQVLGVVTFPGQVPLPLDVDQLEQTIIFDGTAFLFVP